MDKLINYEKLSEFKNKLLNDNVASPKATWSSKKITTHINAELANYATTASVDASLALKADKSYVDASLALKADVYEVATTADIEALFASAPTYPPLNQFWYESKSGHAEDLRAGLLSEIPNDPYENGHFVHTFPQDADDQTFYYAGEATEYWNDTTSQPSGEYNYFTKVWLPYLKGGIVEYEEDGETFRYSIIPFKNMFNNQEFLTDVYYPGTVDEMTECFTDEVSGHYYGAMNGAGTNIIHCSDGDYTVPVGS